MIRVRNKHAYKNYGFYIGRGSPLGNPFTHLKGTQALYIVETREAAVECYYEWLRKKWLEDGPERTELIRLAKIYKRDNRMDLICYCHPKRCHGDILKIAIPKIARTLE